MDKMPYHPKLDLQVATTEPAAALDWRSGLPVLTGVGTTLRELRNGDAASLQALLTTEDVGRFISRPPPTVEGFERFIAWAHRKRTEGTFACFAVTLEGLDTAIGIFQVRAGANGFETAEWGFVLASAFWGTGVFQEGARLVIEFSFTALGVRRLEARAAVQNVRGHGALLKLGAVQEAVLRKSFEMPDGRHTDQALYSIVDKDWRDAREVGRPIYHPRPRVH